MALLIVFNFSSKATSSIKDKKPYMACNLSQHALTFTLALLLSFKTITMMETCCNSIIVTLNPTQFEQAQSNHIPYL